jgi:hypothetical protein
VGVLTPRACRPISASACWPKPNPYERAEASRLRSFLQHAVKAIQRVADYTAGLDETSFLADAMVQDAVIRNIEVMGEAARNVERATPSSPGRIRIFRGRTSMPCATASPTVIFPWTLPSYGRPSSATPPCSARSCGASSMT